MPFIPHTEEEVREMLDAIGVNGIEDLFDEIPQSLRIGQLDGVPEGISEMEMSRRMHERAQLDGQPLNFIGAGAYEHHVPSAVWEITTRGEFYSAYTPYQAEASQGTLQLLYEFQTMMASLMAMDVSNASLYDGATSLAEAILMAIRANRKSKSRKIVVPTSLHPRYRQVVQTLTASQGVELLELDFDPDNGTTSQDALSTLEGEDITAVVINQPNFFGRLEAVDEITDWAHAQDAMVIAVVNPLAMTLIKPPGEWGETGADIACGDGQPLGVPLASGGPYYGFMTCRQSIVRQMPGRIVGKTVDMDGTPGYALTLQAREQHIRRSKATSNICTNQGLVVTASTIHMSILGAEGLRQVAIQSHTNTNRLAEMLEAIDGVSQAFAGPGFHEFVVQIDADVDGVLRTLSAHGVQGGYNLTKDYPQLGNSLLVCVTETKTEDDMQKFAELMDNVIGLQRNALSPVQPKMA